MESKRYRLYTDGSIQHQHGPGAWAALLIAPDGERTVFCGHTGDESTTSQRMEIQAVLMPLYYLDTKDITDVDVYTDSRYVVDWAVKFLYRKNMRDLAKEPNGDLLQPLYKKVRALVPSMFWIPAHTGIDHNEFVHNLAYFIAHNPEEFHSLPLPDSLPVIRL